MLIADIFIFCNIDPIGYCHEMLIARIISAGANNVAADLILFAVELKKIRALCFALHEPFARKFRYKLGKAYIRSRSGQTAYGEKHLVSPDNARIIEPENDYRQRKIKQRIILGRFRVIRHRLDIRKQRLSAARAHDQRVNYKCKDNNALGRGKIKVFRDKRRHRERDQEKHKRPCIRFKQSL